MCACACAYMCVCVCVCVLCVVQMIHTVVNINAYNAAHMIGSAYRGSYVPWIVWYSEVDNSPTRFGSASFLLFSH